MLWLLMSLNPSSAAVPVVRARSNLSVHSPMSPGSGADSAEWFCHSVARSVSNSAEETQR